MNILQLQDKEKDKFLIEDKKNKKTGVTVTGEQIMQDFNARKYVFIPAVIKNPIKYFSVRPKETGVTVFTLEKLTFLENLTYFGNVFENLS